MADRAGWRVDGARLELFRCVGCGGPLLCEDDLLRCSSDPCALTFPVIDGAPVLLSPASVFARPESTGRHYAKRTTSPLRDFVFRITPDLELKVGGGARALERTLLAAGRERTRLLNIGGKHRGAATSALRARADVEILELDFSLSPLTHAVADPQRLPLPDSSFDAVVVDAVLEHVPDPAAAAREIHRVLRSDGIVFADTPFLLPVHAGPFDFSRFSHRAHRKLFAQFEEIESGISNGPAMALCWSIQQFLLSFARTQRGRYAVKLLCRLSLFWLKYADLFLHERAAAYDGALAFYFLGRKSEREQADQELVAGYRGITPSLLGTE